MMPGLMQLIRAPRLPQANRICGDPQGIAALRQLIGVEGIRHAILLEEVEIEKILRRRHGQRPVLLDRQGRKAMAGLRGDDHARPALSDHVAEQFEHQRRSVKINLEDDLWRRLAGRDSGRMDKAGDVAPRAWAVFTRAATASREETSTVAVLT